jgi:hypothetical protein
MPARNPQVAPWHEVAVDLIGPWKIRVNGRRLKFRFLTSIDTVTNYTVKSSAFTTRNLPTLRCNLKRLGFLGTRDRSHAF